MYGKSSMETYITICEIDSQREFAICLRKLKQGLSINLEVGMGREMGERFKREGIYVYLWLTPGVDDGQGGLACCSPWGHRVGHD